MGEPNNNGWFIVETPIKIYWNSWFGASIWQTWKRNGSSGVPPVEKGVRLHGVPWELLRARVALLQTVGIRGTGLASQGQIHELPMFLVAIWTLVVSKMASTPDHPDLGADFPRCRGDNLLSIATDSLSRCKYIVLLQGRSRFISLLTVFLHASHVLKQLKPLRSFPGRCPL